MAQKCRTTPFPLTIGVDGDKVQVPRPVSIRLRRKVRDPHRPTIVVGEPEVIAAKAAVEVASQYIAELLKLVRLEQINRGGQVH